MTTRKPRSPDAITRREAAKLLGISEITVRRFRRDGLLSEFAGYPSYSRSEVLAIIANPWLSGRGAARVLGVSHNRISQLAADDRIPYLEAASGRKYYRRDQLLTVANARRAKREGFSIG